MEVNVDLQTRINSGIRIYFYDISVKGNIVPPKRWLGIWPEGDLQFASKVIKKVISSLEVFPAFEASI